MEKTHIKSSSPIKLYDEIESSFNTFNKIKNRIIFFIKFVHNINYLYEIGFLGQSVCSLL